ncbi:MAG: hypothetical protein CVV13_00985 [Gammaproteobacteria bacterium HGW-Gammaproteobacteria-3]|nr:MAG: hypothetical protein CVV13_00985 [Gammaproteobacteria bacterium HGW-Gammaproteobacteria-3]
MNILKLCVLILLMIGGPTAFAAYPKNDQDFRLLPPYCKARSSDSKSPEYQLWQKRLGSGFLHIHHYCAGLFTRDIANRTTNRNDKKSALKVAVGEMQYVFDHASPSFVLLPKISYDQGQIFEQLGDIPKAFQAYQRSIKLNPKLAPPYAALSDLYIKQNNTQDAIKVLEQGLHYKPNSKALLKRMAKLRKTK